MLGYAMRRVLSAIPIALIAITVCFFILRLAPGGPFDGDRALPPITLQNLRAHYNLDEPLWMQYFIYVGRLLQGVSRVLGDSLVRSPRELAPERLARIAEAERRNRM